MCVEKEATQQTVLEDTETLPFHPPTTGGRFRSLTSLTASSGLPRGLQLSPRTDVRGGLPSHVLLGTAVAALLDLVWGTPDSSPLVSLDY